MQILHGTSLRDTRVLKTNTPSTTRYMIYSDFNCFIKCEVRPHVIASQEMVSVLVPSGRSSCQSLWFYRAPVARWPQGGIYLTVSDRPVLQNLTEEFMAA